MNVYLQTSASIQPTTCQAVVNFDKFWASRGKSCAKFVRRTATKGSAESERNAPLLPRDPPSPRGRARQSAQKWSSAGCEPPSRTAATFREGGLGRASFSGGGKPNPMNLCENSRRLCATNANICFTDLVRTELDMRTSAKF